MFQTFYDENIVAKTINLNGNLVASKPLACRGDGVTVSYNLNELPSGLSFSHWELSINAAPIWRNNTSVTFYFPTNSPYPTDIVNITGYFTDRFNNIIRGNISVEFLSRSTLTPYNITTYSISPTSGYTSFDNTTFCTGISNGQYIYVRFNRRLKNISLTKSSGNSTVIAGDRVKDGYDYMIYISSQNQYNFFTMTGTDICSGEIKSANECIWLPRSTYLLKNINGSEIEIENNNFFAISEKVEAKNNLAIKAFSKNGEEIILSDIIFESNNIRFKTSYSGLIILKIIESNKNIETIKFLK
jgi:hypothetical protein